MPVELALAREQKLDLAPSIGYNNLTATSDGAEVAFSNREDVVIVRALGATRVTQPTDQPKGTITSVTSHTVKAKSVIAYTNARGVAIVDGSKDLRLAWLACDAAAAYEFRTTALLETPTKLQLAIGTTDGQVAFSSLSESLALEPPTFVPVRVEPQASITCLAAIPDMEDSGPALAVGCNDGTVAILNASGTVLSTQLFEHDCATFATFAGNRLAVGFGSGTVRLFDTHTGALKVAIGAHSRWIVAGAYNGMTNRLATVSEDSRVCVWTMPTPTNPKVNLLAQTLRTNALLTGCAFSPTGDTLTAVAYDVDTAWVYALPPVSA